MYVDVLLDLNKETTYLLTCNDSFTRSVLCK